MGKKRIAGLLEMKVEAVNMMRRLSFDEEIISAFIREDEIPSYDRFFVVTGIPQVNLPKIKTSCKGLIYGIISTYDPTEDKWGTEFLFVPEDKTLWPYKNINFMQMQKEQKGIRQCWTLFENEEGTYILGFNQIYLIPNQEGSFCPFDTNSRKQILK